jgi:hypothetical protein
MQVLMSRVEEVRAYLEGHWLGAFRDRAVRTLASRWRALVAGRETSPRWQKAAELVRELEKACRLRLTAQERRTHPTRQDTPPDSPGSCSAVRRDLT